MGKNLVFRHFFLPLLLCEIFFIVFVLFLFYTKGYLPAPLFFDAGDTFMDFFHTNFWAFRDGRFEYWHSIYPLPVFVLSRIFSSQNCSVFSAYEMRSCDINSISFVFLAYAVGMVVATLLFIRDLGIKKVSVAGGLLIFVSFSLCLPGVFALERGNYVIFAFLFLGLSRLCGLSWVGAIFLAIAINIKQYLVVFLLLPFLGKRVDYLVLVLVFIVLINVGSYFIVSESNYLMLFDNMKGFSNSDNYNYIEKMWYPTSISFWSGVFRNSVRLQEVLGNIFWWAVLFLNSIRFLEVALCIFLFFFLFREGEDKVEDGRYWLFLLMALQVLSDSLGGYSLLLLIPFMGSIFRNRNEWWFAWLVLLLFIPIDVVVGPHFSKPAISFLSGGGVDNKTGMTLGSYIRPFALLLVFLSIFCRDVPRLFKKGIGRESC